MRSTATYLPESYTELGGEPNARWSRRVVARAQSQDVILSCEQALGSGRLCYRNLPERLDILGRAFQGAPITMIVFLRPQLPWLESNYMQLLQEGKGLQYPVESYLSTALDSPFLRWSNLVETVATEFRPHKLRVLEYSPNTAIKQIAHECQLTREGPTEFRANTSLSAIRGLAMSELVQDSTIDKRVLRFMLQSRLAPSRSQRRSPFTLDQQSAVLEHFRHDWDRVSHRQEAVSAGQWEEWKRDEMARPLEPLVSSSLDRDLFEEYLMVIRELLNSSGHRVSIDRRIHQLRYERADLFRHMMRRCRRWFTRA